MKIVLVQSATKPGDLERFVDYLTQSTTHDIIMMSDEVFEFIDNHPDTILSAALYEVTDSKGTYHVAGLLDTYGITAMFHTREMLTSPLASGVPVLPSPSTELDLILDKARRYDQIISAAGTHKLRLTDTSIHESFDTVEELHTFLDTLYP